MKKYIFILWYLLLANTTFAFSKQDTLRGSNGPHRAWWDVQKYNLDVRFNFDEKSISGSTFIQANIINTPTDSIQIDLQEPLILDSVVMNHQQLSFSREGNVFWIKSNFNRHKINEQISLTCYYHGVPRAAVKPPWDGGFSWKKDAHGKPWVAVSCQGLGASSWWPCKDDQRDEPDQGIAISYSIPNNLYAVANGKSQTKLTESSLDNLNENKFNWLVKSPINLYDVTFYIGDYIHWTDTLMGEKGKLELTFYALRNDSAKARHQFKQVKPMLHCFEYWLGPYPFYDDGYKLVQAPYLGMEHQSAIAYGNLFQNGYLGTDRSGTKVGLNWDYIIIHESGHEWFGNNITAQDVADNWLHEGFTSYTEALYTECNTHKKDAYTYAKGLYKNIDNDKPIIGIYGVNDEGSGDKYDKGQAVVHMIRMMLNDDRAFKNLLRGMNEKFYHSIITTQQMEDYIIEFTHLPLQKFFDQYLRSTKIPVLEIVKTKTAKRVRFSNCVPGFSMAYQQAGQRAFIINDEWQSLPKDTDIKTYFQDFLLQ